MSSSLRQRLLVVETCSELRRFIEQCKQRNQSIGFVPTMGALHAGHASLVRRARAENDVVISSIFVNPLQFGPNEDFAKYPRQKEADLEILAKENVDVVFFPKAEELYPQGFSTSISVGEIANQLCGFYRPKHFDGVCTVVTLFFNLVEPTRAYFGKKDYQQYFILDKMVKELKLPVVVVGCETVRESDGLAMSSRNQYLNEPARKGAGLLFQTLKNISAEIKKSSSPLSVFEDLKQKQIDNLREYQIDVQYLELRNRNYLSPFFAGERVQEATILIAAFVITEKGAKVRLIDNLEVENV